MKVLIIHNVLWAHYKSLIFDELEEISLKNKDFSLLVVQIATTERSRVSMGNLDRSNIKYPYELIEDGILEDVPLKKRISGMLSAIRKFKPDVVNITGYYDFAFWIVLFYCKIIGIKTVLSNESTAGDHQRKGVKEQIKAFFVRQFDGYFNFGSLSAQYMLDLGAKPEQLLVNKNCVDNKSIRAIYDKAKLSRAEKQVQLGLSKKNFIFVGRLISFKNLPVLLEAFNEASNKIKDDWGLIVLGDGEQKTELEKMGSKLVITNNSIELKKSKPIPFEGVIETYNDHRMAMSFSPLALVYNSIKIANPEVVSKSYPRFWKDLKSVGFSVNL